MSWSVSAAGTGAASWQSSSPSEFALPRDIGGGKILILAWGVDYHYTTPSGSLYQVLIRVIVVHGYGCMSIQGYSGKGAKVLPYFLDERSSRMRCTWLWILGLCGEITTRKEEAPCRCIIAHLFHLSLCRFSAIARCLKLRSKPAV